jgi:hypothetical protein
MFRYAQFSRCIIDNYDEILQLIPPEPNIAIPLLRSLRQNAVEMGDKDSADRILMCEIEAEKKELKNQFWAPSEYYRSRYGLLERTKSGLAFLALKLRGYLWGHGLKVSNLLFSAVACIVVFACVIQMYGLFFSANSKEPTHLDFWQALYISSSSFMTLGYAVFIPASKYPYIICTVESFLGIVFWGFLAATVYRKFSR